MYLQRPWGRVPGPARPQPVFDFKLSHYPAGTWLLPYNPRACCFEKLET